MSNSRPSSAPQKRPASPSGNGQKELSGSAQSNQNRVKYNKSKCLPYSNYCGQTYNPLQVKLPPSRSRAISTQQQANSLALQEVAWTTNSEMGLIRLWEDTPLQSLDGKLEEQQTTTVRTHKRGVRKAVQHSIITLEAPAHLKLARSWEAVPS